MEYLKALGNSIIITKVIVGSKGKTVFVFPQIIPNLDDSLRLP